MTGLSEAADALGAQATEYSLRTEPKGETFPAASRLLRRSDFQRVQERGLRNAGTALVLFAHPNSLGRRRLGITVSKRVGIAVCRVRIRRLIRDIFRKERGHLPASVDVVVIARRPAAEADRTALAREFLRAAGYFRKRMASFPAPDFPAASAAPSASSPVGEPHESPKRPGGA